MLLRKKKRFGTLALSKGFINTEQLIEALTIQMKENIKTKKNRPIGEILLQLGHINTKELKELLEPRFEQRFGETAVSMGFINLNHLVKAMAIQAKEGVEGGNHRLLGEILIERGHMNKSQVNEVLKSMNK